jgi:hypothetical protein
VTVRLEVDGRATDHVFRPKGFKSDGLSVGELRVPLAPGRHSIAVSIATSVDPAAPRPSWSAEIETRPRRLTVLSYEPSHGFQFAP